MAERRQIITLLTDFGTADYFVGAMKGVILSLNPDVELVDISHNVPAYNIAAAGFTLRGYYNTFPPRTVHLVVVDPGVGSSRRPIIVMADKYTFVGPDNGIFSYVYAQEPDVRVIHITAEHYFRQPVSSTFHGRDLFAPVAAYLSKGVDWSKMGEEITDYVRFNIPQPKPAGDRLIRGHIIHIDRFGNCITNLSEKEISREQIAKGVKLVVQQREITSFYRYFAEAKQGELFAYLGSADLWEIAALRQSAAQLLQAKPGVEVYASRLTDYGN